MTSPIGDMMQVNVLQSKMLRLEATCSIGWGPVQATASLTGIPAGSGPLTLNVTSTGSVGQLVFGATNSSIPSDTISVPVNAGSGQATFFISGKFGFPSVGQNDAEMTVSVVGQNPGVQARTPMTIRVRKDANTLTRQSERQVYFGLRQA